MNVQQVLAIARYEMLMAFRRRTLVIVGFLMLVGIAVFTQISLNVDRAFSTIARYEGSVTTTVNDAGEEVLLLQALPVWLEGVDLQIWTGGAIVVTTLMTTMIAVVIALVFFVSEVIPLDGAYRTHELLNSLPLSRTSYLAGKVFGVWLGLLSIILIAVVLSAIWFRVNFAYDVRYFLLLWFVVVVPVILICGAVAVLLPSWLTSRRLAIVFSLFVIPFALYIVVSAVTTMTGVGVFLHPSYAYYAYTTPDSRSVEIIPVQMIFTLIRYVVLLAIVWTVAWVWQRYRDAR